MNALDFQLFRDRSTGQIVDVYNPQKATVDYVLRQVEAKIGSRVAYITNVKGEIILVNRNEYADVFFRNFSFFETICVEPKKKLPVTIVDSTHELKVIESHVGEFIKDLKERASRVFQKHITMLTFDQRILKDDEVVTPDCSVLQAYGVQFVMPTTSLDRPALLGVNILYKGSFKRIELNLDDRVSDLYAKIFAEWPGESNLFLTYNGAQLIDYDQVVSDLCTDSDSFIKLHSLDAPSVVPSLQTLKDIKVNLGLTQIGISIVSSANIGEVKSIVMETQGIDSSEFELVFLYNAERLLDHHTLDKISDSDPLIHAVKRKKRS